MADERKVTDYGSWLAAQYGLTVTNQRRSPGRNAAVGGAPRSDHLTGMALDLAGDPKKMAALAAWARANTGPDQMFRYVEYGTDDHQDHVHLSFNKNAPVPAVPATAGSPEEAPVSDTSVQAASAPASRLTPTSTPEEIEAAILGQYPDLAPFMGDEAIKWILYASAINDWDDAETMSAIRGTEYWRTHNSSSRAFDALLAVPGQQDAQVLIGRASDLLSDLFQRNGINLSDEELGEAAKQAIRSGDITLQGQVFNNDALNDMVAARLPEGSELKGETAFSSQTISEIARGDYMLPITRREADQWAVDMLSGSATEQSIRADLSARAAERYPHLGLQAGQTVRSRTDAVVATIADVLEIDPDTIDLLAPKWKGFFEGRDEKTGATYLPSLAEAAEMARHREEFAGTKQFQQADASFSRGLIDMIEGRG
jgi:hypothetical protein